MKYVPKFREFGIRLVDSIGEFDEISHCPFCGNRFPGSLREKWFDIMYRLCGDDFDPNQSEFPDKYKTDAWWREAHF